MFRNMLTKLHGLEPWMGRRMATASISLQHGLPLPMANQGVNDQNDISPLNRDLTANLLLRSLFYVKRTKIADHHCWYNLVPADAFVLDLEDAVAYEKKAATRSIIADTLKRLPTTEIPHILIRMNGLSDDHPDASWREDIQVTAHQRLLAYILPKVRHPEEILQVAAHLETCECEVGLPNGHHKLIALIETADGVCKAYDIAKADKRLIGMTAGRGDLVTSLRCRFDSAMMKHACNNVAVAARAAQITPILSIYDELDNHIGFERECIEARARGYGGRSTVTIQQVQTANRTFMVDQDQANEAKFILDSTNGDMGKSSRGRLAGPPLKKEAQSILLRFNLQAVYEKEKELRVPSTTISQSVFDGLVPNRLPGFVPEGVGENQAYGSTFEITINEGARTFWEQHFIPPSKLNTSSDFAKSMGYKDTLVPFSLLANWALSLSVVGFSIKALMHVEITEAVQHLPVYYGDTIRNEVTVVDVEQKDQGYDMVTSRHLLIRVQDGKTVFSGLKKTMFPAGVFKKQGDWEPQMWGGLIKSATDFEPITRALRGHTVTKGQVYVHDLVKSIGPSDATGLSYYLKGLNPGHINNQRKHEDLVVSGPCVVAAVLANQALDLGDVLDEKWSDFRSLNRTLNNDLISTVSYVQDVRSITLEPEGVPLEEVTLTVAGIKNVNPEVLAEMKFPLEFFQNKMKPRDFEKACAERLPKLSHKVVLMGTRTIVRRRPVLYAIYL